MLGEKWHLTDQTHPDFEVDGPDGSFGLEVTNCHAGPTTKGGAAAMGRARHCQRRLDEIRQSLVAELPQVRFWKLDYVGDWPSDEVVEQRIGDAVRAELGETRGEPAASDELAPLAFGFAPVSIKRLNAPSPDGFWRYLPDHGSPVEVSSAAVQAAITRKAGKLGRYRERHQDVRLLVTAFSLVRSGNVIASPGWAPDLCGFDRVYFLHYPKYLVDFPSGRVFSPNGHTPESLAATPPAFSPLACGAAITR